MSCPLCSKMCQQVFSPPVMMLIIWVWPNVMGNMLLNINPRAIFSPDFKLTWMCFFQLWNWIHLTLVSILLMLNMIINIILIIIIWILCLWCTSFYQSLVQLVKQFPPGIKKVLWVLNLEYCFIIKFCTTFIHPMNSLGCDVLPSLGLMAPADWHTNNFLWQF